MNESRQTGRCVMMAALLWIFPAAVAAQPPATKSIVSDSRSAGFRFSADAVRPLLHYQQHVHLIAGTDDRVDIKVFGNGRVDVHVPVYMKRAGDYTLQLDDAELMALMRSMSSKGLMDFDKEKVKQRRDSKMQAMRQRGELYTISDAMDSIVDIQLDEYQRNNRSKKIKAFSKRFKWKNIEQDAKRFNDVPAITDADAALRQLRALMRDPRLVRVQP